MPVEDLAYLLTRAIDTIGDTKRDKAVEYRLSALRALAFVALMRAYMPSAILGGRAFIDQIDTILFDLMDMWATQERQDSIVYDCEQAKLKLAKALTSMNLQDEEIDRIKTRVKEGGLFL